MNWSLSNPRPVLVLACGNKKRSVRSPVHHLYTGTLWATYRAARTEIQGDGWQRGPAPMWWPSVYVLSAQHGLVAETYPLAPYDLQLTKGRVDPLADEVRYQVPQIKGWLERAHDTGTPITFVGGKLYRNVLDKAGFEVDELGERLGIGYKRQALRAWLARLPREARSRDNSVSIDLDALMRQHGG